MTAVTSPALRSETRFGTRRMTCFHPRPPTLDAMIRAAVVAGPDRTALVCGDTRLSFAAMDRAVSACAAALAAHGLTRGDRVAILLENTPEFMIATLGAIRAGCVAVPMNVRQAPRETAYILSQCGAAVLVCESTDATAVPAPADMPGVGLTLTARDGGFARFCDAADPDTAFPETAEEDCVCLLYTSGTTGRPKGARLTNLGMVHSTMGFHTTFSLTEKDVAILAVPGSHVTGLLAILFTMVTCGGTSVLMNRFTARDFLQLAEREGMSYTLMVPAMYNLCLIDPDLRGFDLSRWRIAGFGGAPMPPSSIARMAEVLPDAALCNAYGATETTSPATILPPGLFRDHPGSVGLPLPYADIRVVGEGDRPQPPGEVGEILIGGPMVVAGYWDNPQADAKEFDAEGRWRSGDLGYFDTDGFLHVVDRRKDIVNRGGYKIYCIEVESILQQFDGVLEAAVIAAPDPLLGEKLVAFIHTAGAAIDIDALRTHARANLSSYKVLDRVILSNDPLPRNANGKIVKADLRDHLSADTATA